jgi:hypothetical protein
MNQKEEEDKDNSLEEVDFGCRSVQASNLSEETTYISKKDFDDLLKDSFNSMSDYITKLMST